MIENAIRQYVCKILEGERDHARAFRDKILWLESEGWQIVNTETEDGMVVITSWRTGRLLDDEDAQERGFHIDRIYADDVGEEVPFAEMPDPTRLPPTLAEALFEWVTGVIIEDDEAVKDVAEVSGWPASEIRTFLGDAVYDPGLCK